jgi:hypothetical protein
MSSHHTRLLGQLVGVVVWAACTIAALGACVRSLTGQLGVPDSSRQAADNEPHNPAARPPIEHRSERVVAANSQWADQSGPSGQ